jgi:soluble lytic murein transglycosylase-like protein
VSRMPGKTQLVVLACALGLGATVTAQAAPPTLEIVGKPAARFEQSIEIGKLTAKYRDRLAQARKLHTAPDHDLLERHSVSSAQLRRGIDALDERIEKAHKAQKAQPDFGLAPGVSQSTLDAIAACESGGDPTAVDASGTYYGKYQFDTGTWASVGGSGSPAAASEAEQDYRASLLYSRAGSSPWPVCGQ